MLPTKSRFPASPARRVGTRAPAPAGARPGDSAPARWWPSRGCVAAGRLARHVTPRCATGGCRARSTRADRSGRRRWSARRAGAWLAIVQQRRLRDQQYRQQCGELQAWKLPYAHPPGAMPPEGSSVTNAKRPVLASNIPSSMTFPIVGRSLRRRPCTSTGKGRGIRQANRRSVARKTGPD